MNANVRLMSLSGLLFLLLFFFSSAGCRLPKSEVLPEVLAGRIELTNYQFQNRPVPLSGEWRFRWNELGDPSQTLEGTTMVPVPSHWMDYKSRLPVAISGEAVFEADVVLPEAFAPLAVRIPSMDTAFVLYWNGVEIARNANIYKQEADVFPLYYAPLVRSVPATPGVNRVTLHMVNSIYPRPGFRDAIQLGQESELKLAQERSLFFDVFLSGSLFLIALYHFGLFVLRPKDPSTFYFSCFALVISVRLAVTGEAFLFRLAPITWKISTFLEYLTFYMAASPLILFIRRLYPDEGVRWIDRIAVLTPVPFVLIVLFLPMQVYSQSLMAFQLYTLVAAGYFFYVLIRATLHHRETARSFLAGSTIFLAAYLNDALYAMRLIDSVFLVPFGLFVFFFAQAFLLSKRFATAFQTAETLTRELDEKVKERTQDLQVERDRSDGLLKNILPEEVASELKRQGSVRPMFYPSVSVIFIDFVDFTHFSESMNPGDLVSELDHCFRAFDEIMERSGIEKLKTIGDSYMAVSGVPVAQPDHAIRCCEAAFEIKAWMDNYMSRKEREGRRIWSYRIGIHSGPVTAGVIGSKKFAFDIWGDTVNVASRMESHAAPGTINVSEATYQLVRDRLHCESRGFVDVKGKGQMMMYRLVQRRAD
ncbi:adenylate/guanylate cyclase domain-containing protein [Leptonema illini]|uniref:Adenylate cyclase n=1 Tax=Leptonema illini DSM 21528 TaxID=929563 RepID=H2CHJ2_9LEPT|nr:adenylate/guanylate cyclase domain-containing protein [Leptonema illini]EHQ04815.1 adenylate/guanylate cyclase [Leptonema illini DSM 21528]